MTSSNAEWPELAALIRTQRQMARLSLRTLARLTNVSDSYLSQVERGLHQPSPEVLKAIAGALGLSPGALFERLGWLDRVGEEGSDADTPTGSRSGTLAGGVEAAIEQDLRLTSAQKSALSAMYRTLVGET